LTPPAVADWVAYSSASNHTTPDSGNISMFRPPTFAIPSSIIVGNASVLLVTLVGDSVLPGPLYLNNILVAPDIIENLLSVRCFTTDNSCSMEFDPFGLSMKDLATRNVIIRSNSSGLVYTLYPLSHGATPRAFYTVAASTWHRHLGHPGRDTLSEKPSGQYLGLIMMSH
jgi:hypothetical protein